MVLNIEYYKEWHIEMHTKYNIVDELGSFKIWDYNYFCAL